MDFPPPFLVLYKSKYMALSFNVVTAFDLDNNTVTVTDNTTYSAQGVSPSVVSIVGLLTITGPTGTAFVSITNPATPATNISTGVDVAGPYNLPLLNGSPLNGSYSVSYKPQYYYTQTEINISSVGNTVTLPGVNIADLFNAGDVFFISLSGEGNNGSKTVVSAENDGADTVIYVSTSLFDEEGVASFTYNGNDQVDLDYTFSGCTLPVPAITAVYDCQSSQFGSITFEDTTDYLDFTVSDHTLTAYYPSGLNPAPAVNPQTTSLYILTLTELASGTWTKNVAATLTKTQDDDLELTVSFNSSSQFAVTCVGTLCSITDCIQALYTKHMDALNCGTTSPYTKYVDGIALLYPLAKEAQACGNYTEYESYYNQMIELLSASGTECDCNCCGNTTNPQWIDNSSQTGTPAFETLNNSYQQLLAQVQALPSTLGPQGPVGPTGAQGVQGIQGPIGPVGPAGLEWRGAWVSGTSYIADDAVGYDGASWFCILATSGTTTPDADPTHWALLAAQGAQGEQGVQGPTGAQGPIGATGPQGDPGEGVYKLSAVEYVGGTVSAFGFQSISQYVIPAGTLTSGSVASIKYSISKETLPGTLQIGIAISNSASPVLTNFQTPILATSSGSIRTLLTTLYVVNDNLAVNVYNAFPNADMLNTGIDFTQDVYVTPFVYGSYSSSQDYLYIGFELTA